MKNRAKKLYIKEQKNLTFQGKQYKSKTEKKFVIILIIYG